MRRGLGAMALAAALLAVPAVALAQSGGMSGLLLRVQGDLAVEADESADLVMVVSGDALVEGRAAAVVVVGGTARLSGARVGHLVVVRGTAELDQATVVTGDVWLISARLEQAPGAAIGGAVHQGVGRFGAGWLTVSLPLTLGVLALVLLSGLLAVAVAAGVMRRAGEALTTDTLGSLTSALVLFVVVPVAAVLLFFTVVGIPVALTVLVVLLPLLGLVGFSVSALRLGRSMLHSRSSRPYGAVLLGSGFLLAVAVVPIAGQVLVLLASAFGAGALALTVWRAHKDGAPRATAAAG